MNLYRLHIREAGDIHICLIKKRDFGEIKVFMPCISFGLVSSEFIVDFMSKLQLRSKTAFY